MFVCHTPSSKGVVALEQLWLPRACVSPSDVAVWRLKAPGRHAPAFAMPSLKWWLGEWWAWGDATGWQLEVQSRSRQAQGTCEAEQQGELDAEKQAAHEADNQAQCEAEQQADYEVEKKAMHEADHQGQLEAETTTLIEAEHKAMYEAEQQALLCLLYTSPSPRD